MGCQETGAPVAVAAGAEAEQLDRRFAAGSRHDRYRWAVRIRWMAILGFFALGCIAAAVRPEIDPWSCALAAVAAATLNAFNQWALSRWQWIGLATSLAVLGDVFLMTYLALATGGASSPFVAMYFVQVLASAMLVRSRIAFACAAASVVGLASITLIAGPAEVSAVAATADPAWVVVWSAFFFFGLGLVAYVGGYVSRQLRQREEALERSNASLRRALDAERRARGDLRVASERLDATERQLEHSEKMRSLGDFVAGVAHELNNPIAVTAANLEVLEEEIDGSVLEIVADCREATSRAARIVADLRQFSRATPSRQWRSVDLNQRVRRTVELARHMFGSGVQLDLRLDAVPELELIPEEIDQVLMNLLSNAARAVGGDGRVEVTTTAVDDPREPCVVVAVSDDGPGVSADVAGRIFEPFFTTRPEGEGVGLGLSLSFAIVERHGGVLRVDDRFTEGARFEMVLPVSLSERSQTHSQLDSERVG